MSTHFFAATVTTHHDKVLGLGKKLEDVGKSMEVEIQNISAGSSEERSVQVLLIWNRRGDIKACVVELTSARNFLQVTDVTEQLDDQKNVK